MNGYRVRLMIGLALIALFLSACGAPTAAPTAAPTPTPVMPILTDGADTWRLTSVTITNTRTVRDNLGREQTVSAGENRVFLNLRFDCVTGGSLTKVNILQNVYLTDSQNEKHSATDIGASYKPDSTSKCETSTIWFALPKDRRGFQLHFLDWAPPMNRHESSQLMINLMLVALLLSACGAPAAAPTPMPPAATAIPPTPIPPTDTPVPTPTDTSTSTPAPRPTSMPTYTPLPVLATTKPLSPGSPMLTDKFNDNSLGWIAAYDDKVSVEGGKLRIASSEAGYVGAAFCAGPCGPYGDTYYYQADLALNKSSDEYYGLTFGRAADGRRYYVFNVAPSSGEYELAAWNAKNWATLIGWKASNKIRRYPGSNTLGVHFNKGREHSVIRIFEKTGHQKRVQ